MSSPISSGKFSSRNIERAINERFYRLIFSYKSHNKGASTQDTLDALEDDKKLSGLIEKRNRLYRHLSKISLALVGYKNRKHIILKKI